MSIEATFDSTCQQCGGHIDVGDEIEKDETIGGAWVHVDCLSIGAPETVWVIQDQAGCIKCVVDSVEKAEAKIKGHAWVHKKFEVD